jgi:hypothetical protein
MALLLDRTAAMYFGRSWIFMRPLLVSSLSFLKNNFIYDEISSSYHGCGMLTFAMAVFVL